MAAVTEGTQRPGVLSALSYIRIGCDVTCPRRTSGGLWGTGKKGALLASLPPVAVVTASVARDCV